ncbi:hypothetical protein AGR13a_Cc210126 [Agrobacterium genomosp. 13 str. CFBP 6927]|uniref:Uncharacterized protein n=1 Tax=Agrobacterium genomosp. 13 str. CFBP 6927 TaxID=1183428 RepID=A0ABM9VDH2_9HYPH|nr:hypothetical protein AGR13a_Cc210126 [Agrobacterium genomosp. 13 str. CFBP 6927]
MRHRPDVSATERFSFPISRKSSASVPVKQAWTPYNQNQVLSRGGLGFHLVTTTLKENV